MKLKCRKCREFLLESHCLVNSHGESTPGEGEEVLECLEENCSGDCKEPIWNVNYDVVPEWMKQCFNKGDWLRGKIFCPKCNGRLGSYNFVQPRKCACSAGVAQPVWLIKSKVDIGFEHTIRHPKPIQIDETWCVIEEPVRENVFGNYGQSHTYDMELPLVIEKEERFVDCLSEDLHMRSSTDYTAKSTMDTCVDLRQNSESSCVENTKTASERETDQTLVLLAMINQNNKLKRQELIKSKCRVSTQTPSHQLKQRRRMLMKEHNCPICLDVFFRPMNCLPCKHTFCEPCIRQAVYHSGARRQCPMCRQETSSFRIKEELHTMLRQYFPKKYVKRQEMNKKLHARYKLVRLPDRQRISVNFGVEQMFFKCVRGIFSIREFSVNLFHFVFLVFIIFPLHLFYCFVARILL